MNNINKVLEFIEKEPPKMFQHSNGMLLYDAIDTLRLSYLAMEEYLPFGIAYEDVERSLFWHVSTSKRWKGSINDNL